MPGKILCSLIAVTVFAVLFAAPADAAKRKRQYGDGYRYGYGYGDGYRYGSGSPGGRVTGQPHTCGYVGFLYDNRGVPLGPYCH